MNTRPTRRDTLALLALGAAGLPLPSMAQAAFPSKPITIVVPYAVGGSVDLVSRLVGQQLNGTLGTTVVENKSGGGGLIGWGAVARADADGHTLLAVDLSFAVAPGLLTKMPFDARKAFTQVTTAIQVPHVLVVNPAVPAKTVAELIALAKAQPGKLNYGSGGNGTNTHLGAELFKEAAGDLDIVHVAYKGAGPVMQDLLGGQVQVLVTALPTALPHIRSGKLRALMVTSARRSAVLPDVPSATDVGLPKMDMQFWVGFAVPAGTPAPVVDRLDKAIIAALALPDSKKRLAELGLEPVGNTPAQAGKLVSDEMDRWAAVVRDRHITAD